MDTIAVGQPRASRRRTWIITILALVIVLVALVGVKGAQIGAMINAGKSFVPPPEAVATAEVRREEWQASRAASATLVAVRASTVAAEVAGTVKEIGFDSGAYVKRGQMLVKLDDSTEQAQLIAARADAELTKANLRRARELRAARSNSPADLDAADAHARQSAGNVATLEATIAKKTIRAPFDGRVAFRQVELGEVLASGATVASLQSITPIHADFFLPQQALATLKPNMEAHLTTDVFPGRSWTGYVTTINPEVDVSTRNVRVRATFPNQDGLLRPGMFGEVQVIAPDKQDVVVIPSTAVMYAPYGDSVFVVAQKEKSVVAQQRFVRLGEHRGDLVAVESGLKSGETVVSAGAFKLRNGVAVVVKNDLAPKAEAAPTPVDR